MSVNRQHYNRTHHRMGVPRDPFQGIYKRVVRVAHSQGMSMIESKRLALTLLPWFPEHYDSVHGAGAAQARVGTVENPGYYGAAKTRTLDRYLPENRSRLSSATLAEAMVAEYIIKNGVPISKEDIRPLLEFQEKEDAQTKYASRLAQKFEYLYIFEYRNAAVPESKIGFTADPKKREASLQTAGNGSMFAIYRLPVGVASYLEGRIKSHLKTYSSGMKTEIFSWAAQHLSTLIEVFLVSNGHAIDRFPSYTFSFPVDSRP